MTKKEIADTQHPWLKLQRALKPYENYWYEWLQSDACFLSGIEERIIGYLFAFKGDIFCAARILELSEKDYLRQLRQLIGKLEEGQIAYLTWQKKVTGRVGLEVGDKGN